MPGEVPKLYKKLRIHACLRMMCWMRTNKQHSWLPAGGRTSNIRLPWIVVLVNHSNEFRSSNALAPARLTFAGIWLELCRAQFLAAPAGRLRAGRGHLADGAQQLGDTESSRPDGDDAAFPAHWGMLLGASPPRTPRRERRGLPRTLSGLPGPAVLLSLSLLPPEAAGPELLCLMRICSRRSPADHGSSRATTSVW